MPDLTVDTGAQAYTRRRGQFADIVGFWGPRLKLYFQLDADSKVAWRAQDPFLDDILRFNEKVSNKSHGDFE